MTHQIFQNQENVALEVITLLESGVKNISVTAPFQSGKSGIKLALANKLQDKHVLITTPLSDTTLVKQHEVFFSTHLEGENQRFVRISKSFSKKDPMKYINKFGAPDIIIVDEPHYATGVNARYAQLLQTCQENNPELQIVIVGATNFQAMNAQFGVTVQMDVPSEYFGVNKMIENDLVIDNSVNSSLLNFQQYAFGQPTAERIKNSLLEQICDYAASFNNGISFIRVNDNSEASELKSIVNEVYGGSLLAFDMTMRSNMSIADTLKFSLIHSIRRNVIVFVNGAMTAGVNIEDAKNRVRVVFENSKTISSHMQGLVGRVCGYSTNREVRVYANKLFVQYQAALENGEVDVIREDLETIIGDAKVKAGLSIATHLSTRSRKKYSIREKRNGGSHFWGRVYKIQNPNDVYRIPEFEENQSKASEIITRIDNTIDNPRKRNSGASEIYVTHHYRYRKDMSKFKAMNAALTTAIEKNAGEIFFSKFSGYFASGRDGNMPIKYNVRIDEDCIYVLVRGQQVTSEEIKERVANLNNNSIYAELI